MDFLLLACHYLHPQQTIAIYYYQNTEDPEVLKKQFRYEAPRCAAIIPAWAEGECDREQISRKVASRANANGQQFSRTAAGKRGPFCSELIGTHRRVVRVTRSCS
ncbi:hypothetical protein GQ55_5G070200 [Panicum hallii var. hallii]|uniref:Uncharacterized protein n=1 Tax=Panicum hallii var. hallii TaxID=1504633 RepID=A0A2T7DDK0_9POAL|nr:hypothetical protein GQ55_5G070200 [Panicum hallii var. hallii]